MKVPHINKKCRPRQENVLMSLRNREIQSKNGCYRRELGSFADDCTALSSFTNKPILTGENLRSTFMIVFSHDGSLLASSHGNHKIKICKLPSMECIQTLRGHPRSVWCLNFHPSSNELLASGCLGGQVRVWDLQGRSEVWNSEKGTTITSLSFHPYERLLAIATGNEVLLWDWSQKQPMKTVATSSSEEYIRLIRFDHHGHHLLTGITNPTRGSQERLLYGRRSFPGQFPIDMEDDVPTEPDTFPEPSLADPPPDNRVPANEQAENTDRDPPSEATSSRTENELSSLSNSQPSDDRSNNQSADDGENIDQSTRQEGIPMETGDGVSPARQSTSRASSFLSPSNSLSSGHGFLTSSSQSGITSQRTPNRVVRVRRSYDGPELVQVRVISERFEGVVGGDRTPRLFAEDLSNAIIIRTEETFHVPDLPDSQTTSEPQAARALNFDSSSSSPSNSNVPPVPPSQDPPAGPSQADETSPFTGLPLGSSLLDHVPNRNERVEHQVSYPVSAADGMVGHVTITRSSPADSPLLRALQLQRNSVPTVGNVSRRTQGARRALPSQLHSTAGGRRGLRNPHGGREEEGGSSESGRRSRLSRFGFARTAIRRRSGHRRHAEDDSPTFPQGEYRTLINQALADAFRGRWSNPAVANNINAVTHRLQWWKFKDNNLPDISNARANILVPCCKLYSDASCDISPDQKFVVTFVPYSFPDQFVVAGYSLEQCNFGSVLFSKKFGADAITLSISPSCDNLLVGVATGQYRCPAIAAPMVMICSLTDPTALAGTIKTIQVVNHPSEEQGRHSTGLNIAKWVPTLGAGFVYGTDKGDLRICRPRFEVSRFKPSRGITPSSRCLGRSGRDRLSFRSGILRQRGQSTQTRRRTHSAGTQTDLTSRFVRRRLNSPTSSPVVGSRLAINMMDIFNSPNQSTSDTSEGALSSGGTVVSSDQSEQVHPTSVTSLVLGSSGTSTESLPGSSTLATGHIPASTTSSGSVVSSLQPASSESSLQGMSSLSAHSRSSDTPSTSDDNRRTLALSSPVEPQIASIVSENVNQDRNSTIDNPTSSMSSPMPDVSSIPRSVSEGNHTDGDNEAGRMLPSSTVETSGDVNRDQSISRSSQVGLNGAMISLSGMTSDYLHPTSATIVTSGDDSITASSSSEVQTSSDNSYQNE